MMVDSERISVFQWHYQMNQQAFHIFYVFFIISYTRFLKDPERICSIENQTNIQLHIVYAEVPKMVVKLFSWGLEILTINSYLLYSANQEKQNKNEITQLQYVRRLMNQLVGDFRDTDTKNIP